MQKPRIVFFGNSKYSVIVERALHEAFGLALVVTIPDRLNSRKEKVESPVKQFAQTQGIDVIEVDKLSSDTIEQIKKYRPDFLVVADYGLILPRSLLRVPVFAPLNVHHSLLPEHRGPSPAPAAILSGQKETGVSIIVMNERVDAGDVLAQIHYTLPEDATTDHLLNELNTLGANALIDTINAYRAGTVHPIPQDETKASHTSLLSREDGEINLHDSPELNWRKIRAFGTWPGTYFIAVRGTKRVRVKIAHARFHDGMLTIERVIPENKKEMSFEDFERGYLP